MSHTRFLQWGEAWVRLSLTPGPTAQDDLAAMVSPDRMIVLPVALEGIPRKTASDRFCALEPRRAGWAGDSLLANWPMASCNASERRLGGTLCSRTATRWAGAFGGELAQCDAQGLSPG